MSRSEVNNKILEVEYRVLNEERVSPEHDPPQGTSTDVCCRFRTPLQSPCPVCRRIPRDSTHSSMN